MIEIVDLPELVAIGLMVEAHWNDLSTTVPAAWRKLFELDTGATSFLEVSISREDGHYHELVGYLAASRTEVPDGLERFVIPAQRYLKTVHDGPLAGIAQGFESLYRHAEAAGMTATDFKLDFGYQPGLAAGRHELHRPGREEREVAGGQPELGQRIVPMGVEAGRDQQPRRREPFDHRGDQAVERPQVAVTGRARRARTAAHAP